MDYWATDWPVVFEQAYKKASKQHRCCECNSAIEPNLVYLWAKGLWDHQWLAFKTCALCALVYGELGEWVYGQLADEIQCESWWDLNEFDNPTASETINSAIKHFGLQNIDPQTWATEQRNKELAERAAWRGERKR